MGQVKHKRFIYRTNLKWTASKKGLLSSPGKPVIEAATPPEFSGHPGIWTPEDLFVASINVCIMTTFLHYAQRENLEFLSYESYAEGVLERGERGFMFTSVEVIPEVSVKSADDVEKVKNLLSLSEKNCLISNSVKSKVTVKARVEVVKSVAL